uniref:Uncharacterized protein n=1 Tax=Setaria digitata TaxID=48799 RepID=A0A915PTB4_9BILA
MIGEISPQDLLLANEEGDGQRRSVEEKEDIAQQEAELDAQVVTLTDEIAELCKDKARYVQATLFQGELDELQINTKTLEEDLKRLQTFRDEQQERLNAEKKKKDNIEEEIRQYSVVIADLKEKLSTKEKQLAAQPMSGEDARALRVRKEELKARIEQANEERQNIEIENDAILSLNFKEASQLRERYRTFVRAFEDISRMVNGTYDPFFAVLDQHSPNEPHFPEFISVIEGKLNGLHDKMNEWIKDMEDEILATNQDATELRQKKALLVENLKHSHDFTLKREDWEDERQKLTLEVDVAQNELDSLHALRNGKLSAHEQLAETRKELQSRQIEFDEAKKKIVNEVAVKFSTLVEQWEHLKKCHDQLRSDEKLLREALNNLIDGVESN